MKEQGDVYHYMNPYKTIPNFQKLLDGNHLRYLQFRVLKIKTSENTYEYIITNLPFSFDINDIKDAYHWRWGAEISFRYLKHANGLLHFHCKKPEFRQFSRPLRGIGAIHFGRTDLYINVYEANNLSNIQLNGIAYPR